MRGQVVAGLAYLFLASSAWATDLRTNPGWLHKPTAEALAAVYPRAAYKKGVGGRVVLRCVTKVDGLLRNCTVVSETPAGLGFGDAALVLVPTILMKPATKNGQPIEAEVTIPINFKDGGGLAGIDGNNVTVIGTTAWAKTPTMAEILETIDKKVGDKFAEGKVVFLCDVNKKTGHLSNCDVANSAPGMVQFTGVARTLVPKFEIASTELAKIPDNTVRVNLAFSFPDMASESWGKRYLAHPQWTRRLNTDAKLAIFPERAAKAGLKTGLATVDCVVAIDGSLTNCTTVSESVPDVDFGEVAQEIAKTFATNPWTEDGLPAEGAHVKMPIRMNYAEPDPVPPANTRR